MARCWSLHRKLASCFCSWTRTASGKSHQIRVRDVGEEPRSHVADNTRKCSGCVFPPRQESGKKKQEAARVWRSPGSSVTWLSATIRTCKLISSVTAWFSHHIFYLFVFLRQQTHSQPQHSCVSIFLSHCSSCPFRIAGVASKGIGMNRCDWNAMLLSDDWALQTNYLSHVFRHSFHKQVAWRHETLSWAIFVLTYPPGSFFHLYGTILCKSWRGLRCGEIPSWSAVCEILRPAARLEPTTTPSHLNLLSYPHPDARSELQQVVKCVLRYRYNVSQNKRNISKISTQ